MPIKLLTPAEIAAANASKKSGIPMPTGYGVGREMLSVGNPAHGSIHLGAFFRPRVNIDPKTGKQNPEQPFQPTNTGFGGFMRRMLGDNADEQNAAAAGQRREMELKKEMLQAETAGKKEVIAAGHKNDMEKQAAQAAIDARMAELQADLKTRHDREISDLEADHTMGLARLQAELRIAGHKADLDAESQQKVKEFRDLFKSHHPNLKEEKDIDAAIAQDQSIQDSLVKAGLRKSESEAKLDEAQATRLGGPQELGSGLIYMPDTKKVFGVGPRASADMAPTLYPAGSLGGGKKISAANQALLDSVNGGATNAPASTNAPVAAPVPQSQASIPSPTGTAPQIPPWLLARILQATQSQVQPSGIPFPQ